VRKLLIGSGIFFALFAYGLFLANYDVRILQEDFKTTHSPEFYDYRGFTNVHTNLGLGSGTHQDVITAAEEAGADFVFFTDLNLFGEKPAVEGYHHKLLVLVGASYSYLDSRIMTYDLQDESQIETLGQAQILLADLLSRSGADAAENMLVLEHPFKPGFQWSGPYPPGLDGIEVINLKSIWQEAWQESKASFIWSMIVYPFNPHLALLRFYTEPKQEVELWDQLNLTQKTIGFAGTDATARTGGVGDFHLKFPSYQFLFELVSNHVLLKSELTGESEGDKQKVIDALNAGQFYMSVDLIGNPKGFVAFVQDGERMQPMGARFKNRPGQNLVIRLPQRPRVPFEIAVLRDGEHVQSWNTEEAQLPLDKPGVYRVVVRVIPSLPLPDGKRWLTWIYTNPFYVE
jgi:hypothetical protein